jgi:UDP-N-acetylmuramoyl-L-alanyl-D-glutamate--2,6-diaminopimelate ligase
MLFENVAKNAGTIVVNLDMENPEEFLQLGRGKVFGYTTNANFAERSVGANAEVLAAENIKLEISDSHFEIQNISFEMALSGLFNIENALAAACVGKSEQIGLQEISRALGRIKGVAGRMETIQNSRGLHILVDFALTPEALKKLYAFLVDTRKDFQAKIIAVFGSCGDRDRGKRPIMGQVVSSLADVVILTNDEPYSEDPEKIISEIAAGIENKKENENLWKISDRRLAIAKALEIAQAGDIIVVTGMGNFETMVVGNKKIPWNDRKVIEEQLQK